MVSHFAIQICESLLIIEALLIYLALGAHPIYILSMTETKEERAAEEAYWRALAERKQREADAAEYAAGLQHDTWKDEV